MFYKVSRIIFEIYMRIFFKLRFYGRENLPDAPYLAVANHASLLDPPLVGAACKKDNVDFMAKKELFDHPFAGPWIRTVGCIPVQRGKNSVHSLREAVRRLRKGRVVASFPEGTRSVDGELQEAKKGVGFLILQSNVPILPIYIEGSGTALSKGQPMKPGTQINVFIGKSIAPSDPLISEAIRKKDYDILSDIVMKQIKLLKLSVKNGTICS